MVDLVVMAIHKQGQVKPIWSLEFLVDGSQVSLDGSSGKAGLIVLLV